MRGSYGGVVPPFVDIFIHHLVEWIDPRLAIVIGQSWCFSNNSLASILHRYMNGQSGAILYVMLQMIN